MMPVAFLMPRAIIVVMRVTRGATHTCVSAVDLGLQTDGLGHGVGLPADGEPVGEQPVASCVITDSGWNCTAYIGNDRCLMP